MSKCRSESRIKLVQSMSIYINKSNQVSFGRSLGGTLGRSSINLSLRAILNVILLFCSLMSPAACICKRQYRNMLISGAEPFIHRVCDQSFLFKSERYCPTNLTEFKCGKNQIKSKQIFSGILTTACYQMLDRLTILMLVTGRAQPELVT